ncbi:helix-turn-helix domain-containing protein [Microbacterium sp. 1P10UB]|uniref:excisionase family DNA-binding protein n=1 Tax=unclassified Microbacterium TaxID=2609290 RepID=UPI0039A00BA4
MSELIDVVTAATLLGVKPDTVRALARKGRLEAVRVPGERLLLFRREAVERYIAQRRSPRSPVSGVRVRTLEPELVTANDLHGWAGRIAQDTAPELLRRLLSTTWGISGVSIRAGDGVALGGWDGVAHSDGTGGSYLPIGDLRFEIGTTATPATKAEDDFANRLSLPAADRRNVHFVFVTTRRWGDKATWAAAKAELNEFRSVTVLDADDLEGWLQAETNVHIWLSEIFGRQPRDVRTLQRWWGEFSSSTDPRLPEELFELEDAGAAEALASFLTGRSGSGVLTVRGIWADQVLATVHRSLSRSDDALTAVVVTAAAAWSRLISNGSPLVLIPTFEEPNIGGALQHGHRVLLVASPRTQVRSGTEIIELAPLGRSHAAQALRASGVGSTSADRLAALYRRSPRAFVRSIALDPRARLASPETSSEDSRVAARLALAMQWTAGNADRLMLEKLTGTDWDKLEQLLIGQELTDDPMFVRAGDSWRVAAPVETSLIHFPRLTATDVRLWVDVLKDVLLKPHPFDEMDQTQRLIAEMDGDERPRSAALAEGAMQGLILMALIDDEVAGAPGSERADAVARILLFGEHGESIAGETWARLAPSLPFLAEAAPDVFLDAVHDELSNSDSSLAQLFPDDSSHERDLFATTSPHVYLLWALEVLARSAEHFDAAMMALANLSERAPFDSGSGNTAIGSLKNFLYPWLQYTDAGTPAKLAFVERLAQRKPEVAWRLLPGLLPDRQFFSMQPATPRFRAWGPEVVEASPSEWIPVVARLNELMVASAGMELARWTDIVPRLKDMSTDGFDLACRAMDQAVRGHLDAPSEARPFRRALEAEITRHEQHQSQGWAMKPDRIERLRAILDELPAPSTASRHAPLFGWRPHIEGFYHTDERFRVEWDRLQREAMSDILAAGPIALEELLLLAQNPHGVGIVLADFASEEHDATMIDWVVSSQPSRAQASRSYLSRRMAGEEGARWAARVLRTLSADEERQIAIALLLDSHEATRVLDDVDPALEARYWQHMDHWGVRPEHARAAFDRLRAVRRPISALNLLESSVTRGQEGTPPPFDLQDAQAALEDIARGDIAEKVGDASSTIASALDIMQAQGASVELMARLEFTFYAFIEDSTHRPAALYEFLRENPSEFVALVEAATKPEGKEEPPKADVGLATLAWRVLSDWRELPGTNGTSWEPDSERLRAWVASARHLLAEKHRTGVGDSFIGGVLATGAEAAPEGWPSIPVRDLIEELASRELERGFGSSARNARGMWTKSLYEGGIQERELAQRFTFRADEAREWRRTSRVLRRIAESYEQQARAEDASAKWDEDDA